MEDKEIGFAESNLWGLGSAKVLVMEECENDQSMIGAILTQQGIDYDLVSCGKEAIHLLHENMYDMIFMDVHIREREVRGITTTRIVRNIFDESKKDIPIIAMTVNANYSELEECFNAGMNDFIVKPFPLNELNSVFQKWSNKDYSQTMKLSLT